MPYDPESGLVFIETVVKRKSDKELERDSAETNCLGRPPKYVPPEHGPPTLVRIAMRKILCNLDMLDGDSLSTVPSTLLERIWKAITRSQLDSLRTWKLFAQSSIGQRSILKARRPLLLQSIEELIVHSFSPTCSWITNLEITNPHISPAELIAVSRHDNLRSFLMATEHSTSADMGVNDRVLRAWAEAARDKGALQNLRFMFLYSQLGVTKWSLPHLNAFPNLDEFCAYECGVHWKDIKLRQGWRKKPEGSFFTFAKASLAHKQQLSAHSGMRHVTDSSWNNLVLDYVRSELSSSNNRIDGRPVLQVRVDMGYTGPLHRLDDPPAMVCLKRSTEPHLVNKEALVEQRDKRPLVKKRKIVFDSGGLNDMIGG